MKVAMHVRMCMKERNIKRGRIFYVPSSLAGKEAEEVIQFAAGTNTLRS